MEDALAVLAVVAGHTLPEHELRLVGAYLAEYWREVEALRAVALPEEAEPVVQFHLERWD
ncbi:MAG: hypothetical protein QN183_08635 [Armatimonadota bacterium]|nr:hypothetical protein [Armatimonadota bacterium]MDR7536417.1 hypothetical protein [Armatimonadota bacterium]